MRYWYTDAGEWAAHSLDDSDWIWLRSGEYWGYLRGGVVHDRSGPHLGFVWSDGHRLVTDRSRGNYGNAGNRGNPGRIGNPGNPGRIGRLSAFPSGVGNLFE